MKTKRDIARAAAKVAAKSVYVHLLKVGEGPEEGNVRPSLTKQDVLDWIRAQAASLDEIRIDAWGFNSSGHMQRKARELREIADRLERV